MLVMSACGGGAVPAYGSDGANCPKHPGRPDVHALRDDHRAFLGPPRPGRESLGRAVLARAGTQLASWRDADDAVRRRRTVHHLWAPVSRARLGKHGANLGDAFNAPYVHQCVTTVTVEGDATLDLTISSTTDLVALNMSSGPTPPNSRVVSGTVFEITPNGRQPVGNVWVGWEASGSGDLMAETRTDAAGHYRVCGLPRERITLSAAPAYGNVFYASARSWFGCDRGYRDSAEVRSCGCCALSRPGRSISSGQTCPVAAGTSPRYDGLRSSHASSPRRLK